MKQGSFLGLDFFLGCLNFRNGKNVSRDLQQHFPPNKLDQSYWYMSVRSSLSFTKRVCRLLK